MHGGQEGWLYLGHREPQTKFLGPGLRYAVWFQGCLKRCPGCVNPAGHALHSGGEYVHVDAIVAEARSQREIRGVTISGGEPFLQARGLAMLVARIRQCGNLDIMAYSGYTLAELQARQDPDINYILNNLDLLVDGEYREELNANSIYRGSDNQNIHFLSPKYLPWKEKMLSVKNRGIEFVQRGDELFIVGLPEKNFNQKFHARILEAGESQ